MPGKYALVNSESHSVVSNSLRFHGILQAKIQEWVACPFSRGSFQPRHRTQVFCITGGFFFFYQLSYQASPKYALNEHNWIRVLVQTEKTLHRSPGGSQCPAPSGYADFSSTPLPSSQVAPTWGPSLPPHSPVLRGPAELIRWNLKSSLERRASALLLLGWWVDLLKTKWGEGLCFQFWQLSLPLLPQG